MSRIGGRVAIFLILYAVLLCILAPLRPLWLDELLQLSDTYGRTFADTAQRVAHNPGGVPGAYLAENFVVNLLGHPLVTARIFAIVCAVAGMAALLWIAQMLKANSGWLRVGVCFAILPLALRYALEARQYGPAVAFSIVATAIAISYDRRPSWWKVTLYTACATAAIYMQPYAAFVAAAHSLWALKTALVTRNRSTLAIAFGGLLAILLFLPWYRYAHPLWVQAIVDEGFHSSLNWKTPLVIFRELSGGGYALSAILLALAAYGYKRAEFAPGVKILLVLWIAVPFVLALAADAIFGYFFAIRQLLFILPPLCFLAAQGLAALPNNLAGRVLNASVLLLAAGYCVSWFTRYEEDWGLAAATARKLIPPNTCALVAPESTKELYTLYEPALGRSFCRDGDPRPLRAVLIAPHISEPERRRMVPKLREYQAVAERYEKAGGTTIAIVSRPPS